MIATARRLSFAIDYSIYAVDSRNIIFKHCHIIKHLLACSLPLLIGYKNKSSLKNILVKADRDITPQNSHFLFRNYKCGRCTAFKQLIEGNQFSIPEIKVKLKFNFFNFFAKCLSSNAVYLVTFMFQTLCGSNFSASKGSNCRK